MFTEFEKGVLVALVNDRVEGLDGIISRVEGKGSSFVIDDMKSDLAFYERLLAKVKRLETFPVGLDLSDD